jgi:hypothetical protein
MLIVFKMLTNGLLTLKIGLPMVYEK